MSDETPRSSRSQRSSKRVRLSERERRAAERRRREAQRNGVAVPEEAVAARQPAKPKRRGRAAPTPDRGVRKTDARTRRRTLGAVAVLIALVLLVAVPIYAAWQLLLVPDVPAVAPGIPVQLEIPSGAGTAKIAEILAQAGVIENASMFRLRARLDEIDGKLRPGVYDLSTGMEYQAVVDKLLAGPPIKYVTVTIPEGLRIDQIAAKVEEKTGIPAAEFITIASTQAPSFVAQHPYLAESYNNSLEGYLFPKTYRVVEGSTATDVIELMLDQFDEEMAGVDLTYATQRGLTFNQVVTLASMVEREARLDEERPLVASVIYNRLAKGMHLEIDATIEYVIKENKPRLLYEDLEIDSPYNTYRNAGLPPGPIAAPGLASLKAAAQPAETKYIYYVLTGSDGSHTFAETYDDFLRAKQKSREVAP